MLLRGEVKAEEKTAQAQRGRDGCGVRCVAGLGRGGDRPVVSSLRSASGVVSVGVRFVVRGGGGGSVGARRGAGACGVGRAATTQQTGGEETKKRGGSSC